MKTILHCSFMALALLALATLNAELSTACAQGTAFTYQGRLNNGGAPANGLYDFRFKLASDDLGDNYVGDAFFTNAIPVSNGLFTTTIDFGAGIFNGSNYWLEVDVRTNNPANTLAYTTLAPLQGVTPTPYAIFANTASNVSGTVSASQLTGSIPAGQLSGTYSGALNLDNIGNSFTGQFNGNGGGLTNLNAWGLVGNSGTSPGVNFAGTTDSNAFEIHVNGTRVLRLEPDPRGLNAGNLIGGNPANAILQPGSGGNVIGGGGSSGGGNVINTNSGGVFIGAGYGNQVGPNVNNSAIVGGNNNQILSANSFIGGGFDSTVQTNAAWSTIGGGYGNSIQPYSLVNTIAGGFYNSIQGDSNYWAESTVDGVTIGGGALNNVQANSVYSTIAGGLENTLETNSSYSIIGGGYANIIGTNAIGSFIGGGGFDGTTFNGNSIQVSAAAIVGGLGNTITSGSAGNNYEFIGGGYQNNITGANAAAIGGGYQNVIGSNSYEAVISGGWSSSIGAGSEQAVIGGGNHNVIQGGDYVTIAGGNYNAIQTNSASSTIGGGLQNTIQTNAPYSFIGGGLYNTIYGDIYEYGTSVIVGGDVDTIYPGSFNSTIGGGQNNSIGTNSDHAFVGGGLNNTIGYSAAFAAIGGGSGNQIQYGCPYSTISGGSGNQILYGCPDSTIDGGSGNYVGLTFFPTNAFVAGGFGNDADGSCSFAAGSQAHALNQGAFVWADNSSGTVFASTNNNSFNARAAGGYRLYTSSSGASGSGVYLAANGSSWTSVSDRNAKKNFQPVNYQEVLDKLAQVPIEQWNYKWEKDSDVPNIGPMAQDFKHAFYPGRDDKGISTLEFDGVELAAIQGLNQKLNDKDARIQEQGAEIETLKQNLADLQKLVQTLAQKK